MCEVDDEERLVSGLREALVERVGERYVFEPVLTTPVIRVGTRGPVKQSAHVYVVYGKTLVLRWLNTGETHLLDLQLPESDPVEFCVERLRWTLGG